MTDNIDAKVLKTTVQDIKLLILDVDGVLTDGGIILDETAKKIYRFDVHDGSGINYWHRSGHQAAIITGRASNAVTIRAEQLGIKLVYQNAKRKLDAYRQCLTDAHFAPHQVCYVGDDLPDLPVMRNCGYPIAVANAVAQVKAVAAYTTQATGGHGAVREIVEHLLKAKQRWQEILDTYYQQQLNTTCRRGSGES